MSKAIIFLSCLMYIIIFLGQIFGINSANDLIEKKEIASFPRLTLENKQLISELNRYFQDNYGFRNIFLKSYLYIKYNFFNSRRLGNGEYIDNAMMIGEVSSWKDRNQKYNEILYTEEELSSWKNFLEKEKEHVESQGIHYFLVVIPEKSLFSNSNSYKTTIPSFKHQQFINYMKKNSSIDIVDTLEALLKAENEFPLAYKTDTHWTNYGAYIAYLEVMKLISKYNPDVYIAQKNDFKIEIEKYDLWLGDGGFNYPGNKLRPDYGVKFTLKDPSQEGIEKLPAILEYGDSYTNISRRICLTCTLKRFPQVKSLISSLFVQQSTDKAERDPNPNYWYPKDRIENLIPLIKKSSLDKNTQERFIEYLLTQSILPDQVGLDYFLKLSFNKVVNRDIELKINQEDIDEYKPSFVIREVSASRIKHSFNRVKCFYDWDKGFNKSFHPGC